MSHKNPENKPLRIVPTRTPEELQELIDDVNGINFINGCGLVLSNLAIAQSNLVRAGKDSAMPHFIAIVKELERIYGFKFEISEDTDTKSV